MSKINKLLLRLKSKPKDFTWEELVTLLTKLGFTELQGSGSRVKFYHHDLNRIIHLHKPHPAKILKHYVLNEVIEILTRENLL